VPPRRLEIARGGDPRGLGGRALGDRILPAARRALFGDGPPRSGFLSAGSACAAARVAIPDVRLDRRIGFHFLAEYEAGARHHAGKSLRHSGPRLRECLDRGAGTHFADCAGHPAAQPAPQRPVERPRDRRFIPALRAGANRSPHARHRHRGRFIRDLPGHPLGGGTHSGGAFRELSDRRAPVGGTPGRGRLGADCVSEPIGWRRTRAPR
jgi:hypothetical protein